MYRFPAAFRRTGFRFLDSPVPAKEFTALTVGLPATLSYRDPDEVPVFRVVEKQPGWVPSIRRGKGCPHDRPKIPDRPSSLPSDQPSPPQLQPITDGVSDDAYKDSLSFTRPVSPQPVTPGWIRSP